MGGYAGLGHYGYGLGYYGKRSAEPPPSPPLTLMPRLIPTTDTMATDTDMVSDTTVLDTVPTDTVLATTATAMVCTDTTDKCPAIHPKTSLGITSSSSEKWIAQFGLTPTSAT